MGLKLGIVLGFLLGVVGCGAAAPFGYKYYNLKPDTYAGKLEGDIPAHDLSLSVCAPDASVKNKCTVILNDEAYRLKSEVLTLREDLKRCQQGMASQKSAH